MAVDRRIPTNSSAVPTATKMVSLPRRRSPKASGAGCQGLTPTTTAPSRKTNWQRRWKIAAPVLRAPVEPNGRLHVVVTDTSHPLGLMVILLHATDVICHKRVAVAESLETMRKAVPVARPPHRATEVAADKVVRRKRSAEWVGAVRMPLKHLVHKAAEASADKVVRLKRSAEWVGAVRMPLKHLAHKAAEASTDRVVRLKRSAEWVGVVRMPVTHPGHRFAEASTDKVARLKRSAEWVGAL